MPPLVLVLPGSLETRTGGSIYDRRMVEGLRRRGWQVDVVELDASFPHPTPSALDAARRACAGLADGTCVLFDSLALGAMPDVVEREARRLRLVGLMHLPLAAAHGLEADVAERLASHEHRALHAMALVILTGDATRPLLARYRLPANRLAVVEPGTDPAPLARGSGRPLQLLTVGTVHPGKGHEILLEALGAVRRDDWRLVCAGSLTRDPAAADRARTASTRLGLDDRVTWAGDLDADALAACYDRADLFVLATHQETYGMAVAEALARGLPVVATRTGAIPALVGTGGQEAGLLVDPGDVAALTAALSRVIEDDEARDRLAAGARRVRDGLPTWDAQAGCLAAALERVCHG